MRCRIAGNEFITEHIKTVESARKTALRRIVCPPFLQGSVCAKNRTTFFYFRYLSGVPPNGILGYGPCKGIVRSLMYGNHPVNMIGIFMVPVVTQFVEDIENKRGCR